MFFKAFLLSECICSMLPFGILFMTVETGTVSFWLLRTIKANPSALITFKKTKITVFVKPAEEAACLIVI